MLRALAIAGLLFGIAVAHAEPVPLPGASGGVLLGRYADVLEDPGGELRLADVAGAANGGRFARSGSDIPNFGYTYSAFWLRFALPLETGRMLVPMLALEIRFPSIDSIELYVPYRGAAGLEYRMQRGGDLLPWDMREVKHRNHVFRIPTEGLADAPAFLRVRTESALTVPAYLWRPEALVASDRNVQLVYGLFYGLVIALFLYNVMLLLALRDRIYLWYVLYVASFGIALAAFDGLAFQYLWPASVWWANHALATAFCATLLFGTQFARSFLNVPSITLFANRFLLAAMTLAAAGVFFSATGWLVPYGTILRTLSALACASAGIVLYVAVGALLDGYRPARFFLLAWSALLVFIALGALRNFAILPTHFLTVNGLHIGLALDVVLLSFALADRINSDKREKEAAQGEALASRSALLEATQANERELERRIAERTAELNRANEQLRDQEQHLRHLAQHDPLTGLPNRLSMQQRLALAMEIAKRNRKKLAVMMVDLDGFKRLNDSRGHRSGDHVLTQIAGRLRTSVRGSDTVARYGGDEFVVLAGELDRAEDVANIAEKIADMVSLPVSIDGAAEKIGCSIGISIYPDHAEDAEGLIERADRAMYAAKSAKSPRYVFFSPG
jgi:diguanylate cyclase (GGDEF)-like protein